MWFEHVSWWESNPIWKAETLVRNVLPSRLAAIGFLLPIVHTVQRNSGIVSAMIRPTSEWEFEDQSNETPFSFVSNFEAHLKIEWRA